MSIYEHISFSDVQCCCFTSNIVYSIQFIPESCVIVEWREGCTKRCWGTNNRIGKTNTMRVLPYGKSWISLTLNSTKFRVILSAPVKLASLALWNVTKGLLYCVCYIALKPSVVDLRYHKPSRHSINTEHGSLAKMHVVILWIYILRTLRYINFETLRCTSMETLSLRHNKASRSHTIFLIYPC